MSASANVFGVRLTSDFIARWSQLSSKSNHRSCETKPGSHGHEAEFRRVFLVTIVTQTCKATSGPPCFPPRRLPEGVSGVVVVGGTWSAQRILRLRGPCG
ncbi:hypothetical protein Spb1_02340 [Planctopirus ephydatiae]|uniref:Uncharacterized protein n=1 Tax=Planctopirus ephydatiae TaxID=2528019 RepID=A0A518GIE2_9PLAN|nr:hypothetical protein Spb1_02340 [Planctopirus ephydatiae]